MADKTISEQAHEYTIASIRSLIANEEMDDGDLVDAISVQLNALDRALVKGKVVDR
jgi:hypothetical protein